MYNAKTILIRIKKGLLIFVGILCIISFFLLITPSADFASMRMTMETEKKLLKAVIYITSTDVILTIAYFGVLTFFRVRKMQTESIYIPVKKVLKYDALLFITAIVDLVICCIYYMGSHY